MRTPINLSSVLSKYLTQECGEYWRFAEEGQDFNRVLTVTTIPIRLNVSQRLDVQKLVRDNVPARFRVQVRFIPN